MACLLGDHSGIPPLKELGEAPSPVISELSRGLPAFDSCGVVSQIIKIHFSWWTPLTNMFNNDGNYFGLEWSRNIFCWHFSHFFSFTLLRHNICFLLLLVMSSHHAWARKTSNSISLPVSASSASYTLICDRSSMSIYQCLGSLQWFNCSSSVTPSWLHTVVFQFQPSTKLTGEQMVAIFIWVKATFTLSNYLRKRKGIAIHTPSLRGDARRQ